MASVLDAMPTSCREPDDVRIDSPRGSLAWREIHAASSSSTSVFSWGTSTALLVATGSAVGWSGDTPASSRTRVFKVLNPNALKTRATASASIGPRSRLSSVAPMSTSVRSRLSSRFRMARSFWSRRFCPTTPVISSACSRTLSRDPYWVIHLTAVFSPTLSIPTRLSLVSPTRAAMSGYLCGGTP